MEPWRNMLQKCGMHHEDAVQQHRQKLVIQRDDGENGQGRRHTGDQMKRKNRKDGKSETGSLDLMEVSVTTVCHMCPPGYTNKTYPRYKFGEVWWWDSDDNFESFFQGKQPSAFQIIRLFWQQWYKKWKKYNSHDEQMGKNPKKRRMQCYFHFPNAWSVSSPRHAPLCHGYLCNKELKMIREALT